ncbi:MAG: hypothetical protein GY715_14175 [Planctomycetes bacterium]|nr:hypothetical protein [Planctomycetota bacterium]
MRLAKTASAHETIGELAHGSEIFCLTFGQFSLIDAIVEIVSQIGPTDLTIATWTAADAHLERAANLVASSDVRTFRMIVDRSFETRQPAYCHRMRELFGFDCIRFIRSHAKFALLRSDSFDVVIRTSMNLNENPRVENLEISEGRVFAEWVQRIVDSVFDEVGVSEKRSQSLSLDGIPETSAFKPIVASYIDRDSVVEPYATHTIKNG